MSTHSGQIPPQDSPHGLEPLQHAIARNRQAHDRAIRNVENLQTVCQCIFGKKGPCSRFLGPISSVAQPTDQTSDGNLLAEWKVLEQDLEHIQEAVKKFDLLYETAVVPESRHANLQQEYLKKMRSMEGSVRQFLRVHEEEATRWKKFGRVPIEGIQEAKTQGLIEPCGCDSDLESVGDSVEDAGKLDNVRFVG